MSLVNDMLVDLEARNVQRSSAAEEALQPAVSEKVRSWSSVGFMCVGVLVIAALVFFYGRWFSPSAVSMPVAPSESVDAAGEEEQVSVEPVAEISSVVEPGAYHEPVAVESNNTVDFTAQENGIVLVESSSAVDKLLQAAELALAENRLTRPSVNNAHALFSHVLLLQEGNAAAKAGIKKIQQRYQQLITAAVENGELDMAKSYLARAQDVGMPGSNLETLCGTIERAERDLSARAVTESEPQMASVAAQQNFFEEKTAQEEPAHLVTSNSDATGTIEPSLRTRENAVMARARRLLNDGNPHEAIEILDLFVTANPQAQAAQLMLFDLHIEYGRLTEAKALQARAQVPEIDHYFRARLFAQEGQNLNALQQLEQRNPTGAVRQPYLALQAALYQNSGQFAQAAETYRELVRMDKREPKYWLGLGVASEALGIKAEALQAFAAADQLAPENAAVAQYVKQRIQVLSQ